MSHHTAPRPTCPLLLRLNSLNRRWALARVAGRRVPTSATMLARTQAYLTAQGVALNTALAAHEAALAGLPHNALLARLWRRARIQAFRSVP